MLRQIPILDPNSGERSILQGELTDKLDDRQSVYIDSYTGEPHEVGQSLAKMPTDRQTFKVPRTTWHARSS